MPGLLKIPAVNTSSARALPLGTVQEGERLRLHTGHGAIRLDLPTCPPGRFGAVKPRIEPIGPAAAAGFVDDLAAWLRVSPDGPWDGELDPVTLSAVSLGSGREASGAPWDGWKLFLDAAASGQERGLSAELFLRLSPERDQVQLLEKWSAYRTRLPALFERLLGLPVRRWVEGRIVVRPGEEAAWFHEAVGFAVPLGWTRQEVPGGSLKHVDPTDEYGFEVSVLQIPPGLDAVTVLDTMLRGEPRAAGARATHIPADRGELATAEHRWVTPDPHRPPDAPPREARCQWLVAHDGPVFAFLTFVCWTDDAEVALPHWDRAVQTLVLRPPPLLLPDEVR